jgi:hypothetical protein
VPICRRLSRFKALSALSCHSDEPIQPHPRLIGL